MLSYHLHRTKGFDTIVLHPSNGLVFPFDWMNSHTMHLMVLQWWSVFRQVRYLKIIEKSGYQALPWVRYITQNGGKRLSSSFSSSLLSFSIFVFVFHSIAGIWQLLSNAVQNDGRLVLNAEVKLFCEKRMFRTDAWRDGETDQIRNTGTVCST